MIVISAQAAGVQLARGEEAGSIYKYCTAPFRLSRSSFQFKEGIDRVALSRIGFRVDPTSNSPQLPLPASLAEARSRVSLAMLLRPPSQKRADFPAGLAD